MMKPSAGAPAGGAGPVISTTHVRWRGGELFDAGPAGRTHAIDAEAVQAPGPVETLLGAIATCSSVDVLDILAKRRTPVESLEVNVAAERRPEFPRRVQRLEIEFQIAGAGIDRVQAERAIALSFERYCSVAASLGADIVVTTALTLNGERFPAVRAKVWTPAAQAAT